MSQSHLPISLLLPSWFRISIPCRPDDIWGHLAGARYPILWSWRRGGDRRLLGRGRGSHGGRGAARCILVRQAVSNAQRPRFPDKLWLWFRSLPRFLHCLVLRCLPEGVGPRDDVLLLSTLVFLLLKLIKVPRTCFGPLEDLAHV